MRRHTLSFCVILIAFLMVSPLWAQRVSGGGESAGRGADVGASSAASTSSSSTVSASPTYSGSSGALGNRAYYGSATSYARVSTPNLAGSSFSTASEYSYWYGYYSYLNSMYHVYPNYFVRFTRNYEPRMTPALLKIALRDPLIISKEMLKAIDELELMLSDARAGKAIDKDEIIAQSQAIRAFAKEIRGNRTLSILDLSSRKVDLAEEDSRDGLSPETMARLREMALDLNRQLTNLYSLPSASTVSVDSFKEPSFESTAKAIEKVCKVIENSSKRL